MEKSCSENDKGKSRSLAITSALLLAIVWLGIKNAKKFTYQQQVANRLVEFFDGENLIKAKSDFMHFVENHGEEKAFSIVLAKGGFDEHG